MNNSGILDVNALSDTLFILNYLKYYYLLVNSNIEDILDKNINKIYYQNYIQELIFIKILPKN